jgi:uncharacterized protein
MNITSTLAKALIFTAWLTSAAAFSGYCQTEAPNAPQTVQSYDSLISQARVLLKKEEPAEAKAKAEESVKLDSKRYESYAVLTLIAIKQNDSAAAKAALDKALELAPAEKRASLEALQRKLAETAPQSATVPSQPGNPAAPTSQLTGEARRKYDALLLIVEDADKAGSSEERKRLLREFMNKSTQIMASYPDFTNIWVLRAAVACEIKQSIRGWEAGQRLKAWGLENSSDPKIGRVFAMLERNSWLGQFAPRTLVDETDQDIRRFAEEGDSWFQLILGRIYDSQVNWTPRSVRTNDVESAKWYTMAAEGGDTFAQVQIGGMYANGRGVIKDSAECLKWWRKAAEQGDASAQWCCGNMYSIRRGVDKDEAEAVKWWRKAAEQGYAFAQNNLGAMYDNGRGVAKDEAEAVKWFRKAAEQGDSDAQRNLGVMYAYGRGVAKDEAEAVKWYRKAAEQGNVKAQCDLGAMYDNGKGVSKDEAGALKWYRKAAEQGNASAQYGLAFILSSSHDDKIRDGEAAMRLAQSLCEKSEFKVPWEVTLLAATFAERGDFENAKKYQKMALALPGVGESEASFNARLKLYEARKPFRMEDK